MMPIGEFQQARQFIPAGMIDSRPPGSSSSYIEFLVWLELFGHCHHLEIAANVRFVLHCDSDVSRHLLGCPLR